MRHHLRPLRSALVVVLFITAILSRFGCTMEGETDTIPAKAVWLQPLLRYASQPPTSPLGRGSGFPAAKLPISARPI